MLTSLHRTPHCVLGSVASGWSLLIRLPSVLLLSILPLLVQAESLAGISAQEKEYQLWPLLPGETLQGLAMQLYPQSPILQERFVHKAIALSRDFSGLDRGLKHHGIKLNAHSTFAHPQLIAVPNEKALTALTQRIKKADELLRAQSPTTQHLSLSFNLSTSAHTQAQSSEQLPAEAEQQTKPEEANMPKIVFDEPAPVDATSNEQLPSVQAPSIDKPAQPLKQMTASQPKETAPLDNQSGLKAGFYAMLQHGRANLSGNLSAFKQGNLNDWLRHPQLKWLCLEGLALVLLVLYAFIELRLARRKGHTV